MGQHTRSCLIAFLGFFGMVACGGESSPEKGSPEQLSDVSATQSPPAPLEEVGAAVASPDSDLASRSAASTPLFAATTRANESAAIAALRNIGSAQAQCQATGLIDANGNGCGEYGTFGELSGTKAVRGCDPSSPMTIQPPMLSERWGDIRDGMAARSGYLFQMWLPSGDGTHVAEDPTGGALSAAIDSSNSEVMWRVYAWPAEFGVTGKRAFVICQNGDVLACDNGSKWSGRQSGPSATAADSREDPYVFALDVRSVSGEVWSFAR